MPILVRWSAVLAMAVLSAAAADPAEATPPMHHREPTYVRGLWQMLAQPGVHAFIGRVSIDRQRTSEATVAGAVRGDDLVVPFTLATVRIADERSPWTLVVPPEGDGPALYCGSATAPAFVRTMSLLGDSVGFQTVGDGEAVAKALQRFAAISGVEATAAEFAVNEEPVLQRMLADRLLAAPLKDLPPGVAVDVVQFACGRRQPLALREYAASRAGADLGLLAPEDRDALARLLTALACDFRDDGWVRLPALDGLARNAASLSPTAAAGLKVALSDPGVFQHRPSVPYDLRSDGSLYFARDATRELRATAAGLTDRLTAQ